MPKPPRGAKLIPLTQGKFAIVDEDMFEELNLFKWFFHCGYARRNSKYIPGQKRRGIHMSRVVAGVPDGFECDHRSLNKLDNRRSNLRVATHTQNIQNRGACRSNRLGVKGVGYQKDMKKYRARIQVNHRPILIGWFDTVEEASAAYREAAKQYHGEFARA